jgi:hypothetical protein
MCKIHAYVTGVCSYVLRAMCTNWAYIGLVMSVFVCFLLVENRGTILMKFGMDIMPLETAAKYCIHLIPNIRAASPSISSLMISFRNYSWRIFRSQLFSVYTPPSIWKLKSYIIRDITQSSQIKVSRRFGSTCSLLLWGWRTSHARNHHKTGSEQKLVISLILNMDATCSSETSADFQRTTRPYILEDRIIYNHRCQNLWSYMRHQICQRTISKY